MEILSAAAHGLGMIFVWPVLPAMLLGILFGMCLGLIPGLGGLVGIALVLPFAIGQSPEVAFALLLGMYAVTTQTDAIPAILMGVPGTVSATATALDGHPMAKRGEAGRALSASYIASIVGAALSGLIFMAILPVLRPILLQFASPEFFMLAMFGLVMVGSIVSGDLNRGLVMAGTACTWPWLGSRREVACLASPSVRHTCGKAFPWFLWSWGCSQCPNWLSWQRGESPSHARRQVFLLENTRASAILLSIAGWCFAAP